MSNHLPGRSLALHECRPQGAHREACNAWGAAPHALGAAGSAGRLARRGGTAHRLWVFLALLLLVVGSWLHAGVARAEEDFLDPDQAFVFSAATQAPDELAVHFTIAPGYYMYRKRFELAAAPQAAAVALGQAIYPAGIVKYDPTFDEHMEVYHDQITIRIPLKPGVTQPFALDITGQGCADAGLCYPPDTRRITLTPVAGGYQASGPGVTGAVPPPAPQKQLAGASSPASSSANGSPSAAQPGIASALNLGDTGIADYLAGAGWVQIILLCLALGLLLSFTPCVLPMVPILLAILAGTAGTGRHVSRWRGASLAAVFVLGMSLVYTALGIAAGLVGASLAAWLQTPWVLTLFALLLAALALAMFDVFTVQVPTGMQTALNARMARIPGGHYGGVFIMGMLSALIVGPCIAAPLAGVLLFISQTGDVVLGGSALFALAWGEGLLLLVVGASSGMFMPRAGAWMTGVKHFFGILLLATAWWMVNSVVPAWLAMLGWAVLALWGATMLCAFEGLRAGAGVWLYLRKALGLLLALWGAALLIGLAMGGRDALRPLAPLVQASGGLAQAADGAQGGDAARAAGVKARFVKVDSVQALDALLADTSRPVMLDFYADWCVSCIEMERFTFSDPRVAQLMSQLVLVQADVTRNTPEDRALLRRFKLFGPPGIMFFNDAGKQLEDIRVVGFRNARDFETVLQRVLNDGATRGSVS